MRNTFICDHDLCPLDAYESKRWKLCHDNDVVKPRGSNEQVKVATNTTMYYEYSSSVSVFMGPKASNLAPKIRVSAMEGCQIVHSADTDRTPGCVTKMVHDLGWESLKHRRYISRLMMIFKIHHQIVEVSGATEVLQLNDTRTRGSHLFKQSTCATTSINA